jgi:hypothetical protein
MAQTPVHNRLKPKQVNPLDKVQLSDIVTDETAGGFPGFVGDLRRNAQGVGDVGASMLVGIVNEALQGVQGMQDMTGISKLADVRNPILNPARDTMRVAPQFPNPFPVSEAGQDTAQGLMNLVNSVIESDVVQGGIKLERQGEEALNELTGSPVPGATLFAIVNMAAEVAGGGKTAKQLAKEAARKAASPNVGVDDLQSIAAQAEKYDANVTRGAQAQAAGQPLPAQDPSLSVGRTAEFDTDADIAARMDEPVGGRRSTDVPNVAGKYESITSRVDAEKRWSDGEEIYAFSELDGEPIPVTSHEMLNNYTPDQLGSTGMPKADILPFGGRPNPKLSRADHKRLALLDEKFPGIKPLVKYLTPNEARAVNSRNAQNLLDTWDELDPAEMASVAMAGRAKRGWYKRSSKALVDLFGDEDAMRFGGLLAALSPQTGVESNLRNALNMWVNWDKAGRPRDPQSIRRLLGESVEGTGTEKSVMDAWLFNSIDALSADDVTALQLSGAKVDSFMQNIWGNFSEVTNDSWIAKYSGMNQGRFSSSRGTNAAGEVVKGKKTAVYNGINAATRKAAELLSRRTGEIWTPAEIQETVWSWSKSITEKANKSNTPITDLIADLTHSEVADTPDFATLLSEQGEFRSILERGGIDGQKLDTLTAGNRSATEFPAGTSALDPAIQSRHLDAAAQRLEAARREGGKQPAVDNLRASVDRSISREASPAYERRVRGDRRGNVESTYHLPAAKVKELNSYGVSTPVITELRPGVGAAKFLKSVEAAKASHPAGAQVTAKTLKEYEGMRLFLTEDGKSGMALDGDTIVSLFNHRNSKNRAVSTSLILNAIEQGGRRLDNYDTYLTGIYEDLGFQVTERYPWDPAQKPKDWDFEAMKKWNNGKPDYVFMEYRPTKKVIEEMAKKGGKLDLPNQTPQPISQEIDLSRFDSRLRETLG